MLMPMIWIYCKKKQDEVSALYMYSTMQYNPLWDGGPTTTERSGVSPCLHSA